MGLSNANPHICVSNNQPKSNEMQTQPTTTQETASDSFTCCKCGQVKPVEKSGGTGYGTNEAGEKTCYECIGIEDREALKTMQPGPVKTVGLYFTGKEITNWPGSFRAPVMYQNKTRHNFGVWRYDYWFRVEGQDFHGYTIGDNTQIAHVRKLKGKA